jgi:hypothetical protein
MRYSEVLRELVAGLSISGSSVPKVSHFIHDPDTVVTPKWQYAVYITAYMLLLDIQHQTIHAHVHYSIRYASRQCSYYAAWNVYAPSIMPILRTARPSSGTIHGALS